MNLEDIAKKAGVSISTVSRVVNQKRHVGARTIRRVQAVLEEMNYTPNLQARSLVSGNSGLIGMIVSDLDNPFFIDVYRHLDTLARPHRFEVLLTNTRYNSQRLEDTLRFMLGRRVAGLALAVSEDIPPVVEEFVRARIPVISFSSGAVNSAISEIRFDARRGTQKLTQLLYASGHRRMAYLGTQLTIQTATDRKEAFLECAREIGFEHRYVTLRDYGGLDAGRQAIRDLVSLRFDASAILCVNDVTAIGAIRELTNMGVGVPQDVSIVGFDNIAVSEFTCPSLTTVQVPTDQLARLMMRLILDGFDESAPTAHWMLEAELIVRDSSGAYQGSGLLSRSAK